MIHSGLHVTWCVNTDKAYRTLKIFFIGADGNVCVVTYRYAEARAGDYVLSVLRDEGGGVISSAVWKLQNFSGAECF